MIVVATVVVVTSTVAEGDPHSLKRGEDKEIRKGRRRRDLFEEKSQTEIERFVTLFIFITFTLKQFNILPLD